MHHTRALLIRQQTMLASAFRAQLAEFAIAVTQGIRHARALIERVFGEGAHAIDFLPWRAQLFGPLVAQLMEPRNAAKRSLTAFRSPLAGSDRLLMASGRCRQERLACLRQDPSASSQNLVGKPEARICPVPRARSVYPVWHHGGCLRCPEQQLPPKSACSASIFCRQSTRAAAPIPRK
jgi:hypothetical protein